MKYEMEFEIPLLFEGKKEKEKKSINLFEALFRWYSMTQSKDFLKMRHKLIVQSVCGLSILKKVLEITI